MITRFTKIQLVVFVIVTLIGGTYVGGRYAQIDRLFVDRSYPVTATFSDSGGMFAGSQITYRGVEVGRVSRLSFRQDGNLDATFQIENDAPKIPSDVIAVVANKSAIGEQYVDLQPQTSRGPYLKGGSTIALADTRIPIDTAKLLIDVNDLVKSVDTDNLRTVVSELGQAFEGTGGDLSTILDTSNDFITTAEDNIPVTRALIQDSATVLQTQIDTQSSLRTYTKNLALLSDTLVDADPDFRRLLDRGTGSARTLNDVVAENDEDLSIALNNLVTVNRALQPNILGLRAIFLMYPYLLQGTFSVLRPAGDDPNVPAKDSEWDATFGLVFGAGAEVCTYEDNGKAASGYRPRRVATNVSDNFTDDGRQFSFPTPTDIDCKDPNNKIYRQASKNSFNRVEPTSVDGQTWGDLMLDPVTK